MTTKAKKNYNKFQFKPKDTILFGRESEGVPKIVHDKSFQRLKINIKNNSRSLNIGMAAAIALSEALKQISISQNG
jgi:tRNA (cytidine/uridine-2'-O-)-methyltransferase